MPKITNKINPQFLLSELVYSYAPRQSGISTVMAYRFSGILPSRQQEEIAKPQKTAFDPHFTLLANGKNNNTFYQNQIKTQDFKSPNEVQRWNISSDSNLIYQRNAGIYQQPYWAFCNEKNYSFEKLFNSQQILLNLFYLPFVDNIYICGSAALEQSQIFSDLDIIVQTNPFFGLPTITITRFWIKAYLKLNQRDVHPFFVYYLGIIARKISWDFAQFWLEKTYKNFKLNSRLRFDLGLILDSRVDLETYAIHDIDRLWFLGKKKVILENKLDERANFKQTRISPNIFLNDFKYRPVFIFKLLKAGLELISILFYPLFLIQYFWFWLFNRSNVNQFVSAKIWHSFTKVGFKKDLTTKIKNNKVYIYH
jgi:hypothetical protein